MTQNVICIDESGNFESREEHARFLGGCIYKGDSVWEEKALTRMFEKLAEDITEKYGELLHGNRFSYPASFHMSQLTVFDEAMTAQVIDDDDVRRQIKKMILERVKTYLKEKKNT